MFDDFLRSALEFVNAYKALPCREDECRRRHGARGARAANGARGARAARGARGARDAPFSSWPTPARQVEVPLRGLVKH